MATAAAECPFETCGYTGPPESVEAHISGSTDGEHRGSVGRDHRDEIVLVDTSDTSDGGVVESTSGSGLPDGDLSESVDESTELEKDGSDVAPTDVDGATAGAAAGTAGLAAAPVLLEEVDAKVLVAGAILVVVMGYLLLADGDGSSSSDEGVEREQTSSERSGEQSARAGGGLME